MEADKRFQNGVIYTIKTDDGIYVGSTIDFKRRKGSHEARVKEGRMTLLYQNILKNNGNYSIDIHKMYPCDSCEELRKEEQRVSEELNANLNTYRCYISEEIKKQEHAQYLKKYFKTYNRPTAVCECGVMQRKDNLERHRKSKKHKERMENIKLVKDNLLKFLIDKPKNNIILNIDEC